MSGRAGAFEDEGDVVTQETRGFRIEDGVPYIGERAFPWASKIRCDSHKYAELQNEWRTRGFWLTFENGWTLSIQFGVGNYCANRDFDWGQGPWLEDCPNAEIAAWDMTEKRWEFEHESEVLGWQTAEDVLRWIEFFSTQPSHQTAAP